MKILFLIIFWFVVIMAVIATIVIIRANRLQKKKDEEKLKKLQDDIAKSIHQEIDSPTAEKKAVETEEKEIPSWRDYYSGEVEEKFKNDIIKFLNDHKEEVIEIIKESNEGFDISILELGDSDMSDGTNIMTILDEAFDGGAEKLANELDEDVDEITEKWSDEEGWIELERHAYFVLEEWWETNKS